MQDVLSHMGTFLEARDVFLAGRVNKTWFDAMVPNKKNIIKNMQSEIKVCHVCGNCCPCVLEYYNQYIINNFKLKRYICSWVENEPVPDWIHKYMVERKNLCI